MVPFFGTGCGGSNGVGCSVSLVPKTRTGVPSRSDSLAAGSSFELCWTGAGSSRTVLSLRSFRRKSCAFSDDDDVSSGRGGGLTVPDGSMEADWEAEEGGLRVSCATRSDAEMGDGVATGVA